MPTKSLVKLAEDSQESHRAMAEGQRGVMQLLQPHRESRVRLKWDDRLEQLRAFKAKHGHIDVPRSYVTDPSLGTFVCNQRQTYKRMNEGKGPSMDKTRVQQLNELGFKWVLKHKDQPILTDNNGSAEGGFKPVGRGRPRKQRQLNWENGMGQLNAFKIVNGHTDVPHIYAANQPLGNFVKSIRQSYKNSQKGVLTTTKKEPLLTNSRIQELHQIGFKLQVRQREPWGQRFQELRQYVQRHGNCEVPKHTPLGIWILNQRSQFKLLLKKKPSHMSEERIGLLKSIGFDWRIPMKNGIQVSKQVYVCGGRAYVPPAASDDGAPSLPSDADLASALVAEGAIDVDTSSDTSLATADADADFDTDDEKPSFAPNVANVPVKTEEDPTELNHDSFTSLGELPVSSVPSFEIPSNYYQTAASSFTMPGFALNGMPNGMLGYGIGGQFFATKPSPNVRSVTEESASYADTKPSAVDPSSFGTGQSYGMSELAAMGDVLEEMPLPYLPAPIGATMMSSFNVHQSQQFARAPAPSSLPNFTADMFVESLLNGDAGIDDMNMDNPIVTEASVGSEGDLILQV